MVIAMSGMKHRFKIEMPKPQETPNLNLDDKCKIKLTNDSEEIEIAAKDLEVLEELGKVATELWKRCVIASLGS